MSRTGRVVTLALSVALVTGGLAQPVVADQVARSGDPDIVSLQQTAEDILRTTVRTARATYAVELKAARTQRASGLISPKAELAAALDEAATKAERRLARRAYARAAAPVIREYQTAKLALQAKRDAVIDKALAEYLVKTGKQSIADALTAYRDATAIAGSTLELALKSGRDTLKTDTADERAQLLTDLEETTTEAERSAAWLDFQAASTEDRQAYERAIGSARATYASAMSEARREFKLATELSIRKLLKLPFTV